MSEHCAERLVPSLQSSPSATFDVGIAGTSIPGERARLNRIFFLGSVLATQLSWLGALAYLAFRVF